MAVLAAVMAVFVAAGLLPFYLVNVVGRRNRWRRYAVAFPDRVQGREFEWAGAFDGTVGAIELWSRGGFNWLEAALDEAHLHIRISSSLMSSIRALGPLSMPWSDLAACTVTQGGVMTGPTLTFVFSRSTSDVLQAEDVGFQGSFQVSLKFDSLKKADRNAFKSLTDRLESLAQVKDRIRKT